MNFQLTEALAILERTPATLRALLGGLPEAWITASEGPETFSPFDVVGHLLHGDRVDWIRRISLILAQGEHRRFEPYDRFAQNREGTDQSLDEKLDEFARRRAENLATVRAWELTEREFALEGEHPVFGTVTLAQLLSTWTAHDLSHLAQIARVMAKRYRDDVGPWRAYLPIMDR